MRSKIDEELLDRVKATIDEHRLFDGVSKAVIAFSAGPDSVCLLDVIHRLYGAAMDLELVYVNHGLRSQKVLREEEHAVRRYAARYSVSYKVLKVSVRDRALGVEGAARQVRYAALETQRAKTGAQRIVLGHNLDDFVETYLLNMVRGSGAHGLRSMPARRLPYVRPLIDCTKKDILRYLRAKRLVYMVDQTNISIDRRRNLMRLKVLPLLQRINPDIRRTLKREAQILRRDDEYVWKAAERVYAKAAKVEKDCITLDRTMIMRYNLPIKVRLVMKAIDALVGSLEGYESKHYHAVVDLAHKGHSKKIDLPKGLYAQREPETIVIGRLRPVSNISLTVDLNDRSVSIENFTLRFKVERARKKPRRRAGCELFDLADLSLPLVVRNGRAGDVIVTKIGTKKLKKIFSERRVAPRKRPEALMLCDQKGILWVLGHARAFRAYVDEGTRKVLAVEYERTDQ